MVLYRLLVTGILIFAGGCGLNKAARSPIDSMVEFDSTALTISPTAVVGTGRVIATSSLRSERSNFHINMKGQFINPTSSFILHLYFDNFTYDTGIQLQFTVVEEPVGSGTYLIDVEFAEPGKSFRHLTSIAGALASDLGFHLRIETHNEINNSRRILIWNDQLINQSDQAHPRDKILAGNADYDSQRENNTFYTWGNGLRWGLNMQQMRFTLLNREVPFVDP